jgi:DNA-directed RNA polymerase subunit RPC12/RpoP
MPSKPKLPMTSDEYRALEEPRCPYCYSDEIVGGSIQIDGSTAWQPITCVDCGKRWNDIYTIIAYESVE